MVLLLIWLLIDLCHIGDQEAVPRILAKKETTLTIGPTWFEGNYYDVRLAHLITIDSIRCA